MKPGDKFPCPLCGKGTYTISLTYSGEDWAGSCSSVHCGMSHYGFSKESLLKRLTELCIMRGVPIPVELQGDQISIFDLPGGVKPFDTRRNVSRRRAAEP